MKNKFKNILKTMLLFFGIIFALINCRLDNNLEIQDISNQENRVITKTLNSDEIPQIMSFISDKTKGTNSFIIDDNGRDDTMQKSAEANIIVGELITEDIVSVMDDSQKTNYSFKLTKEDENAPYFLNLIVKETELGYYSLITKYEYSQQWMDAQDGKLDFSNYTGKIIQYRNDGKYVLKYEMENGIHVGYNFRNPCDPSDSGNTGGGGTPTGDGLPSGDTGNTGNGNTSTGGGGGGYWKEICFVSPRDFNVYCYDIWIEIPTQKFFRNPCDPDCTTDCEFGVDENCDCLPPSTGGNGGNNTVGVNFGDRNPCRLFNDLESNQRFLDKMTDLKDKAQTDNKETAYVMTANDTITDGYDYAIKEGAENTLGISYNVPQGTKIDGLIHNHWDAPNSLSVFSPHDLFFLYDILKKDQINRPKDFVYVLTTSDSTTYAIRISNKSQFIAYGDSFLTNMDDLTNTNQFLPRIYNGNEDVVFPSGIKDTNNNSLNEKNFTKMVNFKEGNVNCMGLKLYKSDADFENWQEVKYNKNQDTITYDDCN